MVISDRYTNTPIPPDAVKSDRLLVVCPTCHTVHAPVDFEEKTPGPKRRQYLDIALPSGITVEKGENQLIITRSWWRNNLGMLLIWIPLLLFFFPIGFIIPFSVLSLDENSFEIVPALCLGCPLAQFPFSFLFLLIGGSLIVSLINKTIISVTPTQIEITHHPIPNPSRES